MTTYLRRDADGEAAIREISAALFETFDRLARSSDLGRVISSVARAVRHVSRRSRWSRPRLPHQVLERLAPADEPQRGRPSTSASAGARAHVVVRGHGEAVGAGVADGEQRRPARPLGSSRSRARKSAVSQTGPTTSTGRVGAAPRPHRLDAMVAPRTARAAAGRSCPRPRSRTACRGSPSRTSTRVSSTPARRDQRAAGLEQQR